MSTKALFWALEQEIPYGPKITLIMLADWYNEKHSAAWPNHEQLAARVGCGVASVRRHLDWLVKHGLVEKKKQMRGNFQIANRYKLPVGVLVLQGAQYDQAGVINMIEQGDHIDKASNTIKDTLKDTIKKAAEPQKGDSDVKISDALSGLDKMTLAEIETRAKIDKTTGKFTPAALGYIWKHARRSAADGNGFQAELMKQDLGKLKHTYARVGDHYPAVVWNVMVDWIGFTKHAEKAAGAFNSPKHPQVSYFLKFIEAAADFVAEADTELDDSWKVKSIAKPLTKPKETTTKEAKEVISAEDLAKIGETL